MKKLDLQLKVIIIASIFLVAINLLLIPLHFYHLSDIVIGIDIGLIVNILYLLFDRIISKMNDQKLKMKLSIVSIILRFFTLAALLIVFAFLYFAQDIKIANIVAIVGGYTVPIIILMIMHSREKDYNVR